MKENEIKALSDQELLDKLQKTKSNKIISAGFIGLLIGISLYSIWKNGVTFFSFCPLLFAGILVSKHNKTGKALEDELRHRNIS